VHVAINALAITNRSGTGRYTWGLIHGLLNPRRVDMRFSVFIPADFDIPDAWAHEDNLRFYTVPIRSTLGRVAWEQFCLPSLLNKLHVSLLHSTAFVAPVCRETRCKHFITIHDLAYRRYPQTIPWLRRWYYRWAIPRSLRLAHTVITDSYTVGHELLRLPHPPPRILPLHLAVCHLTYHPVHEKMDSFVLQQYKITKPFFLFVGTLEPRKNLETLVQAYSLARQRGLCKPLVIAGRLGWMQNPALFQKEGIQCLGFVPEAHLPALYRQARVLLAPSLYEGFDLPVLEASACGTPVVASDIPIHREILEQYALYVSPTELAAWADALLQAEQTLPPRNTTHLRTWSDVGDEVHMHYQALGSEYEEERDGETK
jgi:glycosyltransferase involved in cell wall biosynthesis